MVRTLSIYNPQNLQGADFDRYVDEHGDFDTLEGMAKMYAMRDARYYPDMTILERRTELLAKCSDIAQHKFGVTPELDADFKSWADAIRALPINASLVDVYAAGSIRMMEFLGW